MGLIDIFEDNAVLVVGFISAYILFSDLFRTWIDGVSQTGKIVILGVVLAVLLLSSRTE